MARRSLHLSASRFALLRVAVEHTLADVQRSRSALRAGSSEHRSAVDAERQFADLLDFLPPF